MAHYKLSRNPKFRRQELRVLTDFNVARGVKSHSTEDLASLARGSTVEVRKVPTGARTVSEKQAHLALHATDEYRFAARHFVGEIEARLGVRNPTPVEPRPQVEMTDEEAEAEHKVRLRRYWAHKRGP